MKRAVYVHHGSQVGATYDEVGKGAGFRFGKRQRPLVDVVFGGRCRGFPQRVKGAAAAPPNAKVAVQIHANGSVGIDSSIFAPIRPFGLTVAVLEIVHFTVHVEHGNDPNLAGLQDFG